MGQPWLAGFSLLADPFLEHLDTFRDLDLVLDRPTATVTWLMYTTVLLSRKITLFDLTC